MNERASHFTILVGASPVAEGLRRLLVQRGMPHAGIASRIRSLRRALVLSQYDLTIICVAVDGPTIERYGPGLQGLLTDADCFLTAVRSVGLLGGEGLTEDAAQLGCDIYVSSPAQAYRGARQLAGRWRQQSGGRLRQAVCRTCRGWGDVAGVSNAGWAGVEGLVRFSPLEQLPRFRSDRFMGSLPVQRPSMRDGHPDSGRHRSSGEGGPG